MESNHSYLFSVLYNGNRTEWSTIQGVIGRFEIKSTITPELYVHEVLLPINRTYNEIREEYDSSINYFNRLR